MFTPQILEDMLQCHSSPSIMNPHNPSWMPTGHVEIAPNCPRCASANTKFCYYNNYSLSQPRYFCKGCRRYWTKGGSLRNVPVGGGCRKNRRSRSVRLSESADRSLRSNYYHDHNCSSNCGDDASEQHEGGNGLDIDMADVFAKFLNQKEPNLVGSNEANALSDDSHVS